MESDGEQGSYFVGVEIVAGGFVDKTAALDDQRAVANIHHETHDLFA